MSALLMDENAPLRLATAAELAFPDGSMTASGLRLEARRGHLVITEKGGNFYTTLAAIKDMRRIAREESAANRPIPCVYIVGFGPYVKIGFTADHFEKRLRALHGGFPEKLTTYATLPNGTREQERALHKRFAAYRLQYEWFKREGELASWIDAGCPT